MKIHLKKVLVSLLVIAGFVFYATYQRYFSAQQAVTIGAAPDTVADLNTTDTVSFTTSSQAVSQADNQAISQPKTLPPANAPKLFAGNGIGDGDEYGEDGEYGEEDDDGGFVQQQTIQSSSGQTTSGNTSSTTATTAGNTNITTAGNTTSKSAVSGGTTAGNTTSTAAGTTIAVTPVANAIYKDGQYDGNAADAYFGTVQVRAIVQGGKLIEVQFLSYPNHRNYSAQISTYVMPILNSEAVQAQNANVNIISGATFTSLAFMNSLSGALNQALV